MKLWFEYCNLESYLSGDSGPKFGFGWYRHHKHHKWFGITFQVFIYFLLFQVNFVDNYKEYDKRINYRKYRKIPVK